MHNLYHNLTGVSTIFPKDEEHGLLLVFGFLLTLIPLLIVPTPGPLYLMVEILLTVHQTFSMKFFADSIFSCYLL